MLCRDDNDSEAFDELTVHEDITFLSASTIFVIRNQVRNA